MQKSKTVDSLPAYLKSYVADQNYAGYTPREHASWRFIMRSARKIFAATAHESYLEGLEKTGISISQIPKIEDMDVILSKFGWGAVCVTGYIPPLVFLDFQAHRILPIAGNMRSLEHLNYTPAPDIVHEAAGHAPILVDHGYADYLTNYAKLARKAIFSDQDIKLYEAVRKLSDYKENPDCTPADISLAEQELKKAEANVTWTSEASLVSRMFWWTVEYGLIGSIKNPKIYGAGLLSSLGEGQAALQDINIKKIPLAKDCVKQSFDITKPQPQLYVAESFSQLNQLLKDLEEDMAFGKGGHYGLELAKKAKTVVTVELENHVQVSGVLSDFSAREEIVDFIRFTGPCQIAYKDKELAGQGRQRHGHGFSSPLGSCLLTDLKEGKPGTLNLANGYKVQGVLKGVVRDGHGKPIVLTWQDCEVKDPKDRVVFEKAWGEFDQVLGERIISVFGGPADWQAYGEYDFGRADSAPLRTSPFSKAEKDKFAVYSALRAMRQEHKLLADLSKKELKKHADWLLEHCPEEWLIGLEIIEILAQKGLNPAWLGDFQDQLLEKNKADQAVVANLRRGYEIAHVPD